MSRKRTYQKQVDGKLVTMVQLPERLCWFCGTEVGPGSVITLNLADGIWERPACLTCLREKLPRDHHADMEDAVTDDLKSLLEELAEDQQ